MTKLWWPLLRDMEYTSLTWQTSIHFPRVRFAVRKASLLQRIDLTKKIKALTTQYEFLKAGDLMEQLDATLADLLVTRLYLEWGLELIEGLQIDGRRASKEALIEKGPEQLVEEILATIKGELALSEAERKNS